MEFEWDENKNAENIKKHDGITFEEAVSAFFDEWALDVFDDSHSDSDEQRFTIIGLAANRLLRVTCTTRKNENDEEIIRIISARKAKGFEKNDLMKQETDSTDRIIEFETTSQDQEKMRSEGVSEDEIPPVGVRRYRRSRFVVKPREAKVKISLYIDGDVLEYFRRRAEPPHAAPYQTQINNELRRVMENS